MLAAAAQTHAAPLTPDQALSRVITSSDTPGMLRAAGQSYTYAYAVKAPSATADAYFVFNSSDGFVIASADDRQRPCLGYGQGSLDRASMPCNLEMWLDNYASEIDHFLSSDPAKAQSAMPVASSDRQAIAPLCTTQWNQSSPFNSACPIYGNNHAVTGCVATAMAQIMKHYNYPAQGTGSYSYTWDGVEISTDFSSSTYEWDKMYDIYDAYTPKDERVAIGRIMADCGAALHMQYGVYVSGAFDAMIPFVITKYFSYSPEARLIYRDAYTEEDWDEIIYNELANGRPVQYAGRNSNGGHSFVCDGYATDGTYHINWGWGGLNDGYFPLSALNPGSQGIGGYEGGYNSQQKAVIYFQPTPAGTVQATSGHIMGWGRFARNESNNSFTLAGLGSHWPEQVTVYLGIEAENALGKSTFFDGGDTKFTLDPYDAATAEYNTAINVSIPTTITGLAPGIYTIHPAYRTDDLPFRRVSMTQSLQPRIYLTVDAAGNHTYSTSRPQGLYNLSLNAVTAADGTPVVDGTPGGISIKISNKDKATYSGDVSAQIFDSEGTAVSENVTTTLDIEPDAETSFLIQGITLSEGDYTLQVYDKSMNNVINGRYSLRVHPANPHNLDVESLSVPARIYAGGPVSLTASVTNFGSNDFSGPIDFVIRDSNGNAVITSVTEAAVPAGQTISLTSAPTDATIAAGNYEAGLNYHTATGTERLSKRTIALEVADMPQLKLVAVTPSDLPSGIPAVADTEHVFTCIFSYDDDSLPLDETLILNVSTEGGDIVATERYPVAINAGRQTFTKSVNLTLSAGTYAFAVTYASGMPVTDSPATITVYADPELRFVSADDETMQSADGAELTIGVTVANDGDEPYSRPLYLTIDRLSNTIEQTVDIPAGQSAEARFIIPAADIEEGTHTFTLRDALYTLLTPDDGVTFTVAKRSGLDAIATGSRATVTASGRLITITNAPEGETITLSDTRGSLIQRTTAAGTPQTIQAPSSGIWIVTVGSHAYKIATY